jgi:hypothetical protein
VIVKRMNFLAFAATAPDDCSYTYSRHGFVL